MPERPDGFDDEVRDALEGIASEPSPPPKAPPGVLASARRRVARNSAALAVALVVVAGGVAAGVGLTNHDNETPIPIGSSETPSPSGSTTSAPATSGPTPSGSTTSAPTSPSSSPPITTNPGPWTGPNHTLLFLDGVVYVFVKQPVPEAPDHVAVGVIPDDTAVQPPVATPFGVVVLGGRAGHETHLWLVTDGGGRELLASHVDGFAVSADGSRIAYATLNENSRRSELWDRPLNPSIHEITTGTPVDAYVRVVGFVGDEVLLDTGDGATSSAATWGPGASTVSRISGFGRAITSDPESGTAVLTEGDGACWSIVSLGPTGNAGRAGQPTRGDGCGIRQASFQSGGDTVAAIEMTSEDRSGPQRFVLQGTTSQLGGQADVDGAFQTLWKGIDAGAPTVLVLAEPEPNTFAVIRCRVAESLCSGPPVWTATAPGGEGHAWLGEQRPAHS